MTLTAPRVGSGANKTMRGTPTAARKGNGQKLHQPKLAHAEDVTVKLSNIIRIRPLCTTQNSTVVYVTACANGKCKMVVRITLTPLQMVTDSQLLKVPLPLCVRTATLTKYSCPTSRPVMSNGEEEGVLGCVAGVEVVLPY